MAANGWKECSDSVVQEELFLYFLIWQMMALHASDTSGTTKPMAQCHIPADLNPQQTDCEDLTTCNKKLVIFEVLTVMLLKIGVLFCDSVLLGV